MSTDGDRLAHLTPDQRTLLERMLREKKAKLAAPPAAQARITRRPPGERPRLSFAQERLWLLDRLAPSHEQSTALHAIGLHFRLEGPLHEGALQRALAEAVRRHEVLRTTFEMVDGAPVQVIQPAPAEVLSIVDLTSTPVESREAEAARRAASEARRPFDLRRDLPLRASLLRLGGDARVLLLTVHHIAFDGWSAGVLLRELSALYGAFAAGRPSPLADLPLQYADFAAWQRGRLAGEALREPLAFWRERLLGAPPSLELPADRPHPAVPSYRGALAFVELPRALCAALEARAQAEGATLFMALLSGYAALLQRCSGQDDIVVGTAVAGRGHTQVEELVGVFINALPLRIDLSGDPSFRALLGRVREAVVAALAHQDLPFEKLVEELKPDRRAASSPIFQTMLVVQAGDDPALALPGVAATALSSDHGAADLDLSLSLVRGPAGLTGRMRYTLDLFDAETVDRLLARYRTLLEAAAADPDLPVSRLEILPQAERFRLLVEWNQTDSPFPRGACVHHLVAAQVARAPEAMAVSFEGESLTYRALAAGASRLAHRLVQLGAGPGARVGVLLTRSPDMVVALLAVLQAGAAYVPLDPEHPADRLAFMLADAQVSLLLTQESLAARLPESRARPVFVDGAEAEADHPGGDAAPLDRARSGDIAYVIYTSGSTGRPKGVSIPHRAVVNFLTYMAAAIPVTERDTLVAVTTLSFDIAGLELYLPLVTGARVVIADRRTASDGVLLRALLARSGATVLQATPATWRLLLDAGFDGGPGFTAVSGGDTLPPEVAERLLPRVGVLYNLYGPTETTIWSTLHRVTDAVREGGPIPIGRPIANTQVYVVDRHLAPVPIGVPGELCIGGDGVSTGYLGRPGLSAERFVPDPSAPGERLYRTGDRARWRADGVLEMSGRLDFQIKLRGHRIEPGEIEAALAAHPAVEQAAVVARRDAAGDAHLAACLVVRGDPPTAGALRAHLATTLPDSMIPPEFVFFDRLPLTHNGKLDRGALAAAGAPAGTRASAHPDDPAAFASPADALEAELVALWEEILGVHPISTRDDFFALGGHSMRAAHLFDRIEARLGRRLPIATLIEASTVERLAALLRREGWSPSWASLVAVRSSGTRPPFFCVHAIGGNVLSYRLLEGGLRGDRPFYCLQSRGLDGVTPPHDSVEQMASDYIEEIRQVLPHGPYRLGGLSSGGAIAYEMAQQLRARGEEVALLVLMDTYLLGRVARPPWPQRMVESVDIHVGTLRLLPGRREQARYLLERARTKLETRAGNLARALGRGSAPAPRTVHEAIALHNTETVRSYQPKPYQGRVVMLLSRRQAERTFEDLRLVWADLAVGGFELRFLPGNHDNMLEPSNVAGVSAVLDDCLRRHDP